ncbi:VWA domain-containing protein [Paenibacillus sp. TAF43_2]|uniref:vWA domain-containing protein n=1 Tax=Paenibacillus sp. TAF43_2 TaxID=3233069 RepID=UPI003F985436
MQFLSVASAWFAFALPAIAAMYILKRTYKNQHIASHLLWRRVLQEQEANRPWQKLRSRWLLILQLLVALILVIALMEPIVMRQAPPDGHAVLLIDRSASMSAKTGDINFNAKTRLESATEAAEIWLDKQSNARLITIVATGAQPEVLTNRQRNKEQMKRQLQAITPFYGKTDHTAALSLADSLLQEDSNGEVVIFTDGQWSDAAEANKLNLHAKVERVIVGQASSDSNVSLLYFGIKADSNDSGKSVGMITIQNDSKREQTVNLDVFAANNESDVKKQILAANRTVIVPAGAWESMEIVDLPPALYYKARIEQRMDAVVIDNTAFQFPTIPSARQALLISEGNLFLEKALQLAGVQTVKISPDSVVPTGEQVNKLDWIILDGMNERLLADTEWSLLLKSKPLWMIDHPDQSDETASIPTNTRVEKKEHPLTTYITFADTHIGRLEKPDASELLWGEPVLSYGGIPAIYAGKENGKAKLRFTFNFQDTDLPLRPEFPILILQAAQWMSGGSHLELGSVISEQLMEISLHTNTVKAVWEAVELTGGDSRAERALLRQSAELDLDSAGLYMAPSIPGLYRLVESDKEQMAVSSRLLAVTVDHEELQNNGADAGVFLPNATSELAPATGIDRSTEEQQISLQLYVAILLLFIMAAEWEVYRRGLSG